MLWKIGANTWSDETSFLGFLNHAFTDSIFYAIAWLHTL